MEKAVPIKREQIVAKYDYLIVGCGLYGATFAHKAKKNGLNVLVIDKRTERGGNLYCESIEGINVHKYGAHIFHTSNKVVWDFVNSLVPFNNYINEPMANYNGTLYNLPFNMNTFNKMWGVVTPQEAKSIIDAQIKKANIKEPRNLEEQAISLVGTDIYNALIKGYTQKQWGRPCAQLPASIIKRIPVRYTFCNNYFSDKYQGVPIGGYNRLIDALLEGVEVETGVDYFENREYFDTCANAVVFTGKIDEYYGYRFGKLEYRTVEFKHKVVDTKNHQGVAVVNYTDEKTAYTRVIEHKHFEFGTQPKSVISEEYSSEWRDGSEAYYPINDERNNELYARYKALADAESKVLFGGRLGEYKYYDMHQVVEKVLNSDI